MSRILDELKKEFNFSTYNPTVGWIEATRWNGTKFLHDILTNFTEVGNEQPYDVAKPEYNGGIIVFAVDVNAQIEQLYPDASSLKKLLMSSWESITNRINKNKKLSRIIIKHPEVFGYSIGKFFTGRYKAKDGTLYDENSLSIEIIDIPFDLVCIIASEIARSFKQQSVLVKDNSSREILFIIPKA